MERIFLTNLSPASVDPEEIVNREKSVSWLFEGLTAWLSAHDPRPGGAFCVLGEKGIGKSILTRRAISALRELHISTTVFLDIDCRPLRSQRDVFREAASQLVGDLQARGDVLPALVAAAQVFAALTRFDEVTLKHAHEHLVQYKTGLDIGGTASLFKWLDTKLGISLTRSKKLTDTLEGSITVDAQHLHEAFVQLIEDLLRHAQLRVVLVLDNLEELRHEAITRPAASREEVRADVEALLHLAEGPLALVVNMRTYYSSVLTRRISKRITLTPLRSDEHLLIFHRRVTRERTEVQGRLRDDPSITAALARLSTLAPTPLAFLTWTEFVLESGRYGESDMREVLRQRLQSHYADLSGVIPKVAALFASAQATVELDVVRAACGRSDLLVRKLLDQQVLLPNNYWDPTEFYLDPELGFLIEPSGG